MQKFNKPDLNSPRYRMPKFKVIDKSFIKTFKEKYPEYESMENSLFKKVVKAFNEKLWQHTIENRDGIELPENLGYLFVGACQKPVKENVDFGKSIKHGIKVIHKNWETDGTISKIFYSNYSSRYKLKDRVLWGFTANRYFKRAVTKEFKENWKRYLSVDKTVVVSKLFTMHSRYHYLQNQEKKKLESYNEFDLTD